MLSCDIRVNITFEYIWTKPHLDVSWGPTDLAHAIRSMLPEDKVGIKTMVSPQIKESGFRNPRNFYLWNPKSGQILPGKSGNLGFGIWNWAQGIRNPMHSLLESRIHVPLRTLESSTWNPESTAWNPECKTVLDSLTRGDWRLHDQFCHSLRQKQSP